MIQATIFQDSHKQACGIELSGHAGYSEYGQDIVCAAVSALALNMANSVEAFTEDPFSGEVEEKNGNFTFCFTGSVSRESRILMDSLILGLKNIRESYGNEYISIHYREV